MSNIMATQPRLQRLHDFDLKHRIARVLDDVLGPTSFACGHVFHEFPNPGLSLNDHGIVGLPLSKRDAEVIISKSRQSPFGKGAETLVDTSVRKSWQLDPAQFSLRNLK